MADFKSPINGLADNRTQRTSSAFLHIQENDGFLALRVFRNQRKTTSSSRGLGSNHSAQVQTGKQNKEREQSV
jgi:hypothetical protein